MTNSRSDASAVDLNRQGRKSLIVEGWRFLPHSYAIVNQWQLLALQRRNINVKVVDVPFYRAAWQAQTGIFNPASEQALQSLSVAQSDEAADVTLRIFAPFTFSPSRSRLTAVFATLEQQLIQTKSNIRFRRVRGAATTSAAFRHNRHYAFSMVGAGFIQGRFRSEARFRYSAWRRLHNIPPDAGNPRRHASQDANSRQRFRISQRRCDVRE